MAASWSSQILGKYGLDKEIPGGTPTSIEDLPWQDQMDLKYGFVTVEQLQEKYKKGQDYAYVNEDPTRVGPRGQAGMMEIAGKTFSDIGTTMLESGKDLARRLPHMALQPGGELDRLSLGVAAPQGPETEITPEQEKLFAAEDQAEKDIRAQRRYELEGALNTRGDVGRFIGEKVLPNIDNFAPLAAGVATGLLTRDPMKGVRVAQAMAPIPAAKVFGLEYAAGIDAGLDPRERLRRASGQALVEWATERLPIGISGSTSALGVAGRMMASEGTQEGAAWVGGSAYDLAEALVSGGDARRMSFLPDTTPEALGEFGESVALGAGMGGGIAAVTSRGLAQVNREKLEEENLKKLKLPTVKSTGDKAFDAGQAAGVAALAEAKPVDLFGDPVDMPKQIQPELTPFDLEQRAAEAFRMSPAGREAKAREEFAAQEAAKRKTLEDNALRTGIRNRLTGQGVDGNVPDQGGLFGADTPANEAERARSASAEASRRTPRVLENDPEGPSDAVYSGGEVGPQVSEREAMDRATDFDTDRSLQENDAEAVVKNRKQFFGPLAEEAALVQARLEAKNASPEALKPFKVDGDTAQDLGDARERYAQAILPQTRKEEQERREKIYDRALDVVVTGRNRFATSNRGSQESVPAQQEQGELDFSGSPAQTGGTTEVEQPSLFTEKQAPVPATQPKPTEFKSRLTAERERISPAVEKGLKAAAAAEKAERTKAVNEEKAKEDALIAASIADVKKAQPELKGEELKNAVYARIEERRRTGQLPETKKASKSSGPKNRLTKKGKKEAKEAKSKEKAEEARARVTKALADEEDTEPSAGMVEEMQKGGQKERDRRAKLYEGENGEREDTPISAIEAIDLVLKDPDTTPELRELAERLKSRKSVRDSKVTFVSETGDRAEKLGNRFGSHIDSDRLGGGSDILVKGSAWKGNYGLHPIIILHEIAHAATVKAVKRAQSLMNAGMSSLSKEDQELVSAYRELSTVLKDLQNKHTAGLDAHLGTDGFAAKIFANEKELVAYTYTDPDVRRYLKYKAKSVWNSLVKVLQKMVGIAPKYRNAFEQVLALSNRIEAAQELLEQNAVGIRNRLTEEASGPNAEQITLESEDMTAPAKEDTKFWRWFQNSKVRNPDGTPKLTYHMTNAGPFWKLRKFKTRAADQQLGTHLAADVEVTNDIAAKKALADNIVGKTASTGLVTVPAYLRINNPLRLEDKGAWGPEVIKQLWDQGLIDQKRFADTTKEYIYLRDKNERSRFPADQLPHEVYLQDLIKSLGFDGVVYLNRYEGVSKKDPAGRYLTTKEQDRYEMTDEQFAERYNAYESYIVFDDNQIKSATGNSGEYSNDTGFIDEMAEPVFKELDVVRNFDKNEAQLSPELTGFRRQVAQWLSSTGKDTAAAREAKDSAVQDRAGQFVQLSQSRNRMGSMLSNANLTPEALKEENLEKLKTSHPAIYNEYKKVRQITRALGLRLARDYKKFNEKNMTEKDWNVLGKILDNDEYFRRTYKKNAPGGLGKKYSLNLLKQAAKDPTSEAAKTVTAAKQLLVDDFLMFPDTWDKTTIKHLRRLHALWTGREPTGLKREEIIDVLEKYRDTTPEVMNEMADNWVLDLLDLRDPNSKIASFFKPGALNKSILLPRENVPEAIRDLWGENKDPLTKLYSTWSALAVATSQVQYLNSEFERANGKFLFDAEDNPDFDRKRNSVQISAAGMGPLSNMFTTPRYKETVEMFVQAQEATMSALLAVRPSDAFVEKLPSGIARTVVKPVARLTKYLATVGSLPGNYLMNALGAPMNMILNGNFNAVSPSFYKNVGKSLKGMRDAIAAYERKEINSETLELLVNGILDSSFVGELQESERSEIERAITSEGFSETTHGIAKLRDWKRMVKSSATDVYAVMDLYAKAANYYAEKHFLKKFYERRGIQKTEKQLQKDAAERIKRTNLTYTRAAALLKASEGVGLSMFLTYFGETWRTAYNNYEVGFQDIKLGMSLKDAGLIRHGTARVAGATAALFASKAMLAMYALPYKLLFGAAGALFGDDDDKEQMIQDGMGDFYEGRILSLLNSGPNGIKSFVDVGRLDPNDPVSTPLRHLMEGNVEEAITSVKDLYLVNTAVSRGIEIAARRVLGTREAKPTMANRTPAVYKAFFDLMTDSGASPRLANELIRGSETVNPLWPPAFSNLYEGLNNDEKPANRNALDGLGLRVVDYDPVSTVRMEYIRKVKSPTDNAFGQIREYLQFGEELDDDAIEGMYLDAVADEYEGFIDASKAVKGALASGASRTSLREGLKEAGVSDEAASSLLNGRFMPRSFSDQFLDGVEAQLVQRAATFSDKAEAKQDVRMLRQKLRMINAKYRNFIPEE